jgi:hypothetical protein
MAFTLPPDAKLVLADLVNYCEGRACCEQSQCHESYGNYGAYLKSRGCDKESCKIMYRLCQLVSVVSSMQATAEPSLELRLQLAEQRVVELSSRVSDLAAAGNGAT